MVRMRREWVGDADLSEDLLELLAREAHEGVRRARHRSRRWPQERVTEQFLRSQHDRPSSKLSELQPPQSRTGGAECMDSSVQRTSGTCMLMRVRALRSRQRRMTSESAAFFRRGMAMRWAGSVMACIFWMKASEEKGVWPYTIWYRMHPRLHTSDGRPT